MVCMTTLTIVIALFNIFAILINVRVSRASFYPFSEQERKK